MPGGTYQDKRGHRVGTGNSLRMALPDRGYVADMSVHGMSVERVMFVVMAVLFGLALIDGNPVFLFYTVLGIGGAAYLYGATKDRPAARR